MSHPKANFGFLLADVSRLLRREYAKRLSHSSLTLAETRLLVYIQRHPGARQIDLADLLEVTPITLARLVDTLVSTGLVERRPAPKDRRAHLIYLTDAAQPMLQKLELASEEIWQEVLKGIEESHIDIATSVLQSMRNRLCRHP